MSFKKVGSYDSHGAPVLRKEVITNSVVTTVADSVKLASGFIALGTAAALVYGHVTAHIDGDGVGLLTTGVAGAEVGSYVNAFTAAAANQTVNKVSVQVDVSKNSIYSVVPDVAIGTTTGSNLAGYKTDLVSAVATDESSAVTTTAQYNIVGVDPENVANQLVNIYESQVFGA